MPSAHVYHQCTTMRSKGTTATDLQDLLTRLTLEIASNTAIEDGARITHTYDPRENCFVAVGVYWAHVVEESMQQQVERPEPCLPMCSIY